MGRKGFLESECALETAARIRRRARPALSLLWESYQFAKELGRKLWDFAVEIDELHRAGLTSSDLRWLICKGFLLHAQEVTLAGQQGRSFQFNAGLCFSKRSCFALTDSGVAFVAASLVADQTAEGGSKPERTSPRSGRVVVPRWDRARQELRVGHVIVKQFKVPAVNQERILAAFEEEGWPVRLDDPLPPQADQDPKRRLHDTINALNRNQKCPLIRFMGDGSGQGIRWALVRPPADDNGEGEPPV